MKSLMNFVNVVVGAIAVYSLRVIGVALLALPCIWALGALGLAVELTLKTWLAVTVILLVVCK